MHLVRHYNVQADHKALLIQIRIGHETSPHLPAFLLPLPPSCKLTVTLQDWYDWLVKVCNAAAKTWKDNNWRAAHSFDLVIGLCWQFVGTCWNCFNLNLGTKVVHVYSIGLLSSYSCECCVAYPLCTKSSAIVQTLLHSILMDWICVHYWS